MPRVAASSPTSSTASSRAWNTRSTSSRADAEFNRLHGALRTGAVVEQAKGILMERHGISPDEAFAELRNRARNTNQGVFDVAQAVILSYPLFKPRPIEAD